MIETGLKHTSELVVTNEVTAKTIGSGDMDVLATPAMMALMENAAMLAVAQHLPKGHHRGRTHRVVSPGAKQNWRPCDSNCYCDKSRW